MEIELGSEVEDITTGFTGITTSRTEYMNGCVQYFVEPRVAEKSELPKGYYIDYQVLKVISKGVSGKYPLNQPAGETIISRITKSVGGSRREAMEGKPGS